jgi:hypothetical protein
MNKLHYTQGDCRMTEERSCGTCGHYVSDMCVRPGGCCFHHSKWQPIAQDKKTMGKIQYTQQEWASIIDDLGWNPDVMEELKQKGYIRKTALEEAKERYEQSKRDFPTPRGVRDLADEYIQELKSEITRLKG